MSRLSFRAIATSLFVAGAVLFAVAHAHAATLQPARAVVGMQNNLDAWCLQGDSAGVDCSFGSRSQCEATAAGGIGECVPMMPGMRERY